MTELIPIFPLELVVYPGDDLNLHIFEPRYQQLINDVAKTKLPFGIPSVVDRKIGLMGTTVELVRVANVQPDGQMDIQTQGLKIFRVTKLLKWYPGKLYSGAQVEYLVDQPDGDPKIMLQLVADAKRLHALLGVQKKFPKPDPLLVSYDLAHHVGLTLAQEFELLGILNEARRQEFLQSHLKQALPMVAGMESLKEKIKLNGHFKTLPGFDL